MAFQMLSHPCTEAVVCQNVIGGDPTACVKDPPTKVRKAYTITKQRERWSEEEHQRFLDALKLHGRAWQHIEEHIGSKTAVQIRSHAQKFFSKMEREAPLGASLGSFKGIEIPPPRPKRKSVLPYPRKEGSPLPSSSVVEEDCQSSAPSIFCAFTPPMSPAGECVFKVQQEEFKKTDASTTSFKLFGKLIVPVSEEFERVIIEESVGSLTSDTSLDSEEDSSIRPINGACYRNHAFHPETSNPLAWKGIYASLPVLNDVSNNVSMVYSPMSLFAMARKVDLHQEMQVFDAVPELHAHDSQYTEQGSSKTSSVCGETSFADCCSCPKDSRRFICYENNFGGMPVWKRGKSFLNSNTHSSGG